MSPLAPTLQAFFTDRLARQRQASGHTIASYRDTLKLLLAFAARQTGKPPSALDIADVAIQLGARAGGSQGPVVKSSVRTWYLSLPHLWAVAR